MYRSLPDPKKGVLSLPDFRPKSPTRRHLITDAERSVLRFIAQGITYQRIAVALGISCTTVGFHSSRLMRKLGLQRKEQLQQFALAYLTHPKE